MEGTSYREFITYVMAELKSQLRTPQSNPEIRKSRKPEPLLGWGNKEEVEILESMTWSLGKNGNHHRPIWQLGSQSRLLLEVETGFSHLSPDFEPVSSIGWTQLEAAKMGSLGNSLKGSLPTPTLHSREG